MVEIIKKATGKSVAEIISERVFKLLGFTQREWRIEGKENAGAARDGPGISSMEPSIE
ncbi:MULTISPECIES: hypothetical protein [Paenibacillus]|uniref:hypothetical protein n=1 Tax=Paenibacillus TaxID=44249 RepID=UPI0015C3941C|nr:hypothetical protein [Paenibacillus lautus]